MSWRTTSHQIAMPPPLTADDLVTYADGTKATIPQMAHDVTTFLAWAAEPSLNERHRIGLKVIFYLLVFAVILYAVERKSWISENRKLNDHLKQSEEAEEL
jgi:ubiquinol-cytochrome c reductase cytochrome c1 subunit